ncbi:MAG: C39 family peptidase [Planctomycetota bacterium]|nr:C39 family peptidase [Planctomycetota bacterium]
MTKRFLFLALLSGTACVLLSERKSDGANDHDVVIKKVPHVEQKPDFCGEACVAMMLQKEGHKVDQDQVFNLSKVDPKLARGVVTAELAEVMKRYGYKPGPVWEKIPAASKKDLQKKWNALTADLDKGIPSIVCMRYDDQVKTTEHFRLVLGYNKKTEDVIYHEPAKSGGSYQRMSKALFLKLWPLKYAAKEWTIIRFRFSGKATVPVSKTYKSWTPAQFSQHFMALKKRIPSKDFTTLIEGPFVVLGDESASRVKQRSKNTVRWAVTHLKKLYFKKDPKDILDVWLFKDKASYEKNTKTIFNDKPGTPFGYYSPYHKALIMNISTGGGTLVHEIVHPFMASNFPECPSWFNEGLASLYEQCGERKGRIMGFTNWRLRGLQKAIRKKAVPSFATLMNTSRDEFYDEDPGTNYSQARYLCYYLQEKGLLVKFFKLFQSTAKDDPSGEKALSKVLGTKDLKKFKGEWEQWVAKLKF